MRAVNIERVKRRVLEQAVAENVDVMRGLPPRAVRPGHRLFRVWLKRAPLVLIPLTLAGSTYLVREPHVEQTLLSAQPIFRAKEQTGVSAPHPIERVTAA